MRLIDADELIHELAKCKDVQLNAERDAYYIRQSEVFRTVNDAPTIEERKKGKWIKRGVSLYRCSECGRFSPSQENYCPSCGSYNGEEKDNG